MKESKFDLLDFVEKLADEYAGKARICQIRLSSFCAPQCPEYFTGPQEEIKAVMAALLDDVICTLPNGAAILEIIEELDVSHQIRFAVSDSRSDMTVEELNHLVSRLSYLPAVESNKTVGAILAELGTKLEWDKGLLGRATRIYFALPKGKASWPCAQVHFSPKVREAFYFLVSNDPPPNRIIQHYMRYHGLSMEGAPTAAESLSVLGGAANNRRFDVLGIAPPVEDMHPFDIAQAIRNSDLKDTKLVYFQIWKDEPQTNRALEAGFDLVLYKPLKKRELFDAFENLFGRPLTLASQTRPQILIAEDNPINQTIALFQVRSLGFDGITVADGVEAVKAASDTELVAIFMDVNMPNMDGVEATRRIRASGNKVPIIGISASDAHQQAAMRAGMTDFLIKTALNEDIARVLKQCGVMMPLAS